MGKVKSKSVGKVAKGVVKAVSKASPIGNIIGMGASALGALKGKGARGRRRSRKLTPQRLVKKLIQERMKNKLLKEKMKPLSYIR